MGRYWPLAGPQKTNYVPREILQQSRNQIVLIEYEQTPEDNCISFQMKANLDGRLN